MGPNSAGLGEAVSIAGEGRAGAGPVLDTRSLVHLPLLIICLKCSVALVLLRVCPKVAEPWMERVTCWHRIETPDRGISIF